MPTDFSIYRLLAPGPVPLAPKVLAALAEPVRHHRTPEFIKILDDVFKGLKWFFQTQEPVMILTTTGSGAMEAALVNTLSPGDHVLCIVSGKFGERWAEMAKVYGYTPQILNIPWGTSADPELVKKQLQKNPLIKAVLCQAVETSTATCHPIKELTKIIKNHSSALFIVDAITGLGAMKLPMDEWGLDVVIAGSQKALMLPTGIAFIALSKKAWQFSAQAKTPRFYLDLTLELKANQKGQTHFSTANSHVMALQVALKEFQKLKLPWLIKRCETLAMVTREFAIEIGLKIYSQSPAASVTALLLSDAVDSTQVRDHLEKKYNVTVMGGQDQLQGKILRIGHLGYITNSDQLAGLEALGQTLITFKTPGLNEQILVKALHKAKQALEQAGDVV